MRRRLTTAVITLLAGAGLAGADPGTCGSCVPTVPMKPVTLYRQPQPPRPCGVAIVPMPAPTLYRKEVVPPEWTEAPPPPPVTLVEGVPPPVLLVHGAPPPVQLVRMEAPPPVWTEAPPKLPVTLFRKVLLPMQCADTVLIPPITLYHKPQPPCPDYAPTCCTSHAADGPPQP